MAHPGSFSPRSEAIGAPGVYYNLPLTTWLSDDRVSSHSESQISDEFSEVDGTRTAHRTLVSVATFGLGRLERRGEASFSNTDKGRSSMSDAELPAEETKDPVWGVGVASIAGIAALGSSGGAGEGIGWVLMSEFYK